MTIFLIKFFVTVFIVIIIAEVAKRVNTNVAGILMGLPLGAAISVYFFAYEQGTAFVLTTIPWGIAGLSLTVIFALAYLCAGRLCSRAGLAAQIAVCTVVSLGAWTACAFILHRVRVTLFTGCLIFSIAIILNIIILEKIRRPVGKTSDKASSLFIILLRACIAGITVSLVTGFAKAIGPAWAGILGPFPVMMFPLMIILHYEEGDKAYPGMVYAYAYGIPNLLVFYVCLYFILPHLGINLTYVILYAVSAGILWLLNKLRAKLQDKKPAPL